MITRKNVGLYVKQTYGLNEKQLFDKAITNNEMFEEVATSLFLEFTTCFYGNKNLLTKDPFTSQTLKLMSKDVSSITSMDNLMQSLSDAHKQRMEAITKSRLRQLEKLKQNPSQNQELEQG